MSNLECLVTCPSGQYGAENICNNCSELCVECNGPLENECTKCNNSFILVEGICGKADTAAESVSTISKLATA